jgi:hypothetical protein
LYTIFGALAAYSGYLLWAAFLGLDSYQFPIRSFGDLGYRLYGPWMRYTFNVLQGIQLLLNVGLIVISNGEALYQASKARLCFIICCLVWALFGFFVGQIRTLQKFGWLANSAVWINIICMFITMAGAAKYPPLYQAVSASAGMVYNPDLVTPVNGVYPPVQTSGGLPESGNFVGSLNGAMQAIFAYGGAMVFPEFMSEMKRPKDFLTAMWAAQAFIYFWYMFYGLFMYGYQGQYNVNPSYLGIGEYNISTAGNSFAMISAAIAAGLYGNIGLKGMSSIYPVSYAMLTSSSALQQYLRGTPPVPSVDHPGRQVVLGRPGPRLLGYCLCSGRWYPQLLRSHRCGGSRVYSAIHLQLPALAGCGVLGQARRAERRRGLRPRHGSDRPPR